ncbi:MAG: hypothetical protein AB8C13_07260 [Phycisphaerales bacterium]
MSPHTTNHFCSAMLSASVLAAISAGHAAGELIVFENTNPAMDLVEYYEVGPGYSVLGRGIDVTRSAFDQPTNGELPTGSFMIARFESAFPVEGDWTLLGTGLNTNIARADELIDVIDPYTNSPVGAIAPADFDDGRSVGADTNWTLGWVNMHVDIGTAPTAEGIYFTDESFMIGVRFTMDDGVHYGFAEMTRTQYIPGEPLSIGYRAIRWGYETIAGAPVPAPGSISLLSFGLLHAGRRKRA